ncbi:hypothetical protein DFJ58DRAFT_830661 [Suillus subalutaceus]|uniref:uncharacterized protein n=1 Tax=Suillus subalutaceus TaxID=48586 RepID=UPI001B85F6DD|nr:uncharacterized protein DFJ58DRAFT_830661 [Suillus subalutaceus]KAG1824067.1 hypothetical protein DFJ58DRAFT_830661 [Suillus subalutaceus]
MSNPLTVTVDTYSALSFSSSTSFAPSALPPSSAPSLSSTPSTTTDSNGQTSTTPATTSTTPTTTSMTFVPTTVPVVIISTNAYGSTVIITTEISTTTSIPVSTSSSSSTNNSSNTGPIVGGVVGGIAAIAIFALLIFCLRRRIRRVESDGNFGPDRVISQPSGGGTLPQVDLGEENEITPYTDHGSSMRQYGESPFLPAGAAAGAAAAASINRTTLPLSSPSQYSDTATTAANGYPSQGFIRPGRAEKLLLDVKASTSLPSKKLTERVSGVVQHQDAGRVHSEEGEPRDIPPAYDSIWQ